MHSSFSEVCALSFCQGRQVAYHSVCRNEQVIEVHIGRQDHLQLVTQTGAPHLCIHRTMLSRTDTDTPINFACQLCNAVSSPIVLAGMFAMQQICFAALIAFHHCWYCSTVCFVALLAWSGSSGHANGLFRCRGESRSVWLQRQALLAAMLVQAFSKI